LSTHTLVIDRFETARVYTIQKDALVHFGECFCRLVLELIVCVSGVILLKNWMRCEDLIININDIWTSSAVFVLPTFMHSIRSRRHM